MPDKQLITQMQVERRRPNNQKKKESVRSKMPEEGQCVCVDCDLQQGKEGDIAA